MIVVSFCFTVYVMEELIIRIGLAALGIGLVVFLLMVRTSSPR